MKEIDALIKARSLWSNLKLRREELEELQGRKLCALVRHAYENVPYYRDLFDGSGVRPEEIRRREDLVRIPVTGKTMLQSLPRERITAGKVAGGTVSDVTSGSTGIPLRVYFTEEDHLIRSLVFVRTFLAAGYRLTDRQAIVCDTRFASGMTHWFQKLGIFRKKYVPVQDDLDKQIDALRKYRPDHIHGYPQSLAIIAREMLSRGIDDISPRVVHTGSELVSQGTRSLINTAFKVEMLDTYATIESGLLAWECPAHRGYHINMDVAVLEFLADGKPALPGERGRTVVTNLHSFAMPIIRYELGDVCVPSDETCPCGSRFPMMGIVEGRADDMIVTPAGKVLSPNSITNALEAVPGIRQFRVVQKAAEKLTVLLTEGKDFGPDTPAVARRILLELAGGGMEVEVLVVGDIPRERTGKIRAVVSEVPGIRPQEGGRRK